MSKLFMVFFLVWSGGCFSQSRTMLGGFQLEGVLLEESDNSKLVVTGNFNFPIVNKYRMPNPATGEPGKVLERLDWKVNVDGLPIYAKHVRCAKLNTTLVYVQKMDACVGQQVSITIKRPRISFNQFGLPVEIYTDDVEIMPRIILNKWNSHL